MKKCNKCKVNISNDIDNCPLCNQELEKINDDFEIDYPEKYKLPFNGFVLKLISFISISISLICLAINISFSPKLLWSILVIYCLLYLWLNIHYAMKPNKNFAMFILIQVVGISILTFLIDYLFTKGRWSINYVIPLLFILGSSIISLICIIKPMKFYNYNLYQFVVIILSFCPMISVLLNITTVLWPSLLATIYSVITLLGMFIFADKKTKHEIKKRLHL